MNDWTLESFLFWLAVAIFVPAIIVHFTLGQNGGHRLYDNKNLSKDEIRSLPFDMLRRRTIREMKGSATIIAGLAVALALYPLGCLLGLPINLFGIPDEKLIFYIAGAVALLIIFGPSVYRKWRDE